MKSYVSRLTLGVASAALMLFSAGCGGGSNSMTGNPPPQPQSGTVNLLISDASTEDWATIGVKVISITLTPQDGGSDVTLYTAPSPAPYINLLQLDQLSEILGNMTVPVGTYTAATVTVSGNPGDVLLTASADPEAGFAASPGSSIPSSQIQIKHTQGSSGSLTVPIKVTLDSPLVVTANQSNALDLEFDLSHPAFIVAHVPPGAGTTMWAVNFNGPVRHRRIFDRTRLILRHAYGTVTSVSSGNTSLSFTKDYPVYPPTNPETAIASSQTLSVLADNANGTLYYDLDAKTHSTIHDFSTIASSIVGKYIRVAARYQVDGSLVAVRLWASSSFNSVWISPEGHVLHVNTGTATLVVENELGIPVPLTIDANTLFYFRTPAKAESDANAIGQGPGFLSNLVRGFKVHASVVDPLAVPLVADSIDIEIARYDGTIGSMQANPVNGITYTHHFRNPNDNYTVLLPFINSATPNGTDPQTGAAISGFKWWNFTFPTLVDSGANAISDFTTATGGAVNFGGTAGTFAAAGETYATWSDPNASGGWAAPWSVLIPTDVPLGIAATGYSNSNASFTMTVLGGTNAVPVDLNTTSGSATLVYQVDFTNNIFTISPIDISTTAGQTTLTNNLLAGTPVKAYGIPQADGSIKDYVLFYFTGVAPSPTSMVN
ncbi:MAG: DUF4382 domain-containing protein [Candidatus Acidiferrales bacterium]